ncbi:pentatricopeptide repeat-containing protein At3g22690 [Arabidopsis lyrata subsp. lyrata]|uniref:pentatricopeptide repeat-containing protein At3g22690 n=1 Tax=Arabidopsis lyrata subsp. lyrata TaxID=81972 RepID=UPI000A29E2B6|nr:pentatricopeptide repeat-containing protein At3g22690 [Arabidopsis lyrata subsp. lyrata]|eukprot:XP_020886737.1 pentatricopeptide repeat-containing protein At3g22690 [Arabidopsis lyrata subsp. lyrata]
MAMLGNFLHFSPMVLAISTSKPSLPNQSKRTKATPSSLKNCKTIDELKMFHLSLTKQGLDDDVSAITKLVARSCELGTRESLSFAKEVFEYAEENGESYGTCFMYNSLIRGYASSGLCKEAILLFIRMMNSGISPDKYTFPFGLSVCAKSRDKGNGIQIHGLIIKMDYAKDLFVQNSLVHFYAECGELDCARKVFDEMSERNVVSWTSMICGYARREFAKDAVDLFFRMVRDEDVIPNSVTMVCVISACAKLEDLETGEKVYDFIRDSGIEVNDLMISALVDMYMKCNAIDIAKRLFDEYGASNLDLCNAMASNYVRQGLTKEALGVLNLMMDSGIRPDRISMLSAISSCSQLRNILWGKSCHGYVLRNGFESWDNICNALIDMYMKCHRQDTAFRIFDRMSNKTVVTWNSIVAGYIENGEVDAAWETFNTMPEKNIVSWNTIISALVQENMYEEAIEVFHYMQSQECVNVDGVTMMSIASACGHLGALDLAKWIYYYIEKNRIQLDVRLGTTLVDMFSRCGDPESAMSIFNSLTNRDVSAWTAAIGAMAMAGNVERAIELFNEMIEQGLKPDGVVFIGALTACCHGGLVQQGKEIFNSMEKLHGVSPEDVHYGCMVDLLGRAGLLEEALQLIKDMPTEPNDVIWNSLLAACRVQGNVEMAAFAAEKIQVLAPERTGSYVLLSNVYASAGRWNDMAKVRLSMKEKGLRKPPGTSVIQIRGKTHEFTSGDESHPEMRKIEAMLDELSQRASDLGHVPDLSNVLMDVDEQEKIFMLSRHSEKLAMAFGLISSNKGTTIRIVKNLRVCSYCHSFAKFASKVYNREIILRDNNRFHFIRQGKCSCSDFCLTDDDLEDLKGCLDLGFGFSYDEIPELCNTLPALELCYSMSQKFLDDKHNCISHRKIIANWKISSPGDNPDDVKARLKYWAQAIACTVQLCS